MWGAYTSLTTPPESLPEDVQEMVFDHEPAMAFDEESFDAGLADSLPELEINSGEPTVEFGTESIAASPVAIEPNFTDAQPTASGEPSTGVTARLSDTPASPQAKQYASTSQTFDLPDPSSVASQFQNGAPRLLRQRTMPVLPSPVE